MADLGNKNKPYPEQPELHAHAPYRSALLTQPANLRQALKDAKSDVRKVMFGVGQGIPSVFVTKLYASARPDFIWIDLEHCMLNRLELHDAIHAASHHSEGQTMVVVRIPKHDDNMLATVLDAGASGIVIPHCDSVEDVKKIANDVYYGMPRDAFHGQRSFSPWTFTPGLTDASLYHDDPFNYRTSNSHICIIAQIESVEGLKNVEEIAALDCVHGLMFGPGDYSADAGIRLRLSEAMPEGVINAMMKISATSQKFGKPMFGGAQHPSQIPMMLSAGYAAIAVVFDVWAVANMVADGVREGKKLAVKIHDDNNNRAAAGEEKEVTVNGKAEGNGSASNIPT